MRCLLVPTAAVLLAASLPQLAASKKLRAAPATAIAPKKQSYRQVLHNHQNVQYYADFNIGGQKISGIFDTGSFELLVRSSRCEECVHPTPPYNHANSHTYQKNGTLTKHVFGSGPCISMMGYETVAVGPSLKAEKQVFWEIVAHQIHVLNTAKFAAIVGIGPNFAYGNSEKTLLMNYGIDEFSICLQKPSGSHGYLNWGADEGAAKLKPSDFATARVVGKHHWVTPLENISFSQPISNNSLVKSPCSGEKGCAAIVDSGTSLIAAPTMALMQLSKQVGHIMEDCSNLHLLPTLTFYLDGTRFELPPQAYVMRVTGAVLEADNVWDILFFKPKIRKLDMCMPAFMEIDMMSQFGPVWILGMPFFRYYHTTFDRVNKAMRFAKTGPDCKPEPFGTNRTQSLLSMTTMDFQPLDVEVKSLIPPYLSGLIDRSKGNMLDL